MILLTDDMENQQAVRLARDADADGERTIGKLGTQSQYRSGGLTRNDLQVF